MSLSSNPAAASDRTSCYHCGERVPAGVELGVLIGGEVRPMCCPGCRAVAELINTIGLDSFYRQRTAYSQRPPERETTALEEYLVYDDPALSASFSDTASDGQMIARLLLGGISCAACTWLIEQTMARLPGVSLALVNLQQNRLDIRFDPAQIPLSRIFTRLDALGYQVRPFQASARRAQMWEESRQELRRLGVAALGMMQVGMFTMALYAGDIQGIEIQYQALLRWVSLVIASFVVLFSSRVFFTAAWRHLRQGALVMDLPVALAIGLAWLASIWATIINSGQVYFDSVVMFTFFLLLGRFFERRMRMRYNLAWFDAESTLPDAVTARRGGEWATLPRVKLQAGDTILVRAGDTVPADARITAGKSAVREDSFNGESLPRSVAIGDTVYASTVNVEAALEGQVLGSYRDSRLAALQGSVELGQLGKPRLARIADRVAAWVVGAILLITTVTALVWSQIAPEQAFWISLAVLVISCPCALALATPAALTSAASALRGAGVIVRGENALEALARATHLLFDKTGTLTEGSLAIARVQLLAELPREQVL
ncbi:MAG: heavy metal translocating P-type ATPase, partial [Halioglobus sp.]